MRRWIWLCMLLALWEVAAQFNSNSVLIAGPSAITMHIVENFDLMRRALFATMKNAVWGFLWGNLAAIGLAAFVILLPRAERATSLLALLVFGMPLVAVGPIVRVISGPGDVPQIVLAALAVYYTTYLALIVGLRAIPQSWSDLAKIYGRGSFTQLITIRARASLPYLFVGLQIAAPAAILGAMIGEFTGAERGMGVLTIRGIRTLDVDATWALASVAAGVSIIAYSAIGRLGQWLIGYAPVIILSSTPTSARRPIWQVALELAGIVIGVLLIWQLAMDAFGLSRFFAKRPADVFLYLANDADARQTLFSALSVTLTMTGAGYVAGLGLGAGLAALLLLSPNLSRLVMPVAVALRSVPIITTAPLIVLALGRGPTGTITVIAIMIFFPTFVACLQGLRQTPGQISDLFKSYRAGRVRLLITAQLPAMLPAFFAAARMAVPAALLAATTTEWLATGKGIGVLMALTSTTSNYNMLWACVAVLSVVSAVGYALVAWAERAVLKTYASEQVT